MFNVKFSLQHRYLLHYLRSLQAWFQTAEWKSVPIARTAMAFLQDFHHSNLILDFRPSHVAVACLCLALHCLGVSVPLANAQEDDSMWFSVSVKSMCIIFLKFVQITTSFF